MKKKYAFLAAVLVIAGLAAAFFMSGDLPEAAEASGPVVEEETEEIETAAEPEKKAEEPPVEVTEQSEQAETPEAETQKEPNTSGETAQPENTEKEQDAYHTDPVPEGKPAPVEPQETEVAEQTYSCTISISCATILNNMDQCDPVKAELVPADGWLLQPMTVSFWEGESVFDVLLQTCMDHKLHMEYMDTPMYNSAYIEGIGNLYEFDVGPLSGWMYSVNGWFPNYGCSRYALQDGDVIEWVYTCDLGADVGDNSMGGQQP